ncbi:MAG: FAD-binding protein [Anaerolineae bacterium]
MDAQAKTVRVEGGCVWGDVDPRHARIWDGSAKRLPFPPQGVGGLTLGGGVGYLTRTYGLTIDNLLSVDIVLADGRAVTASKDENADLLGQAAAAGTSASSPRSCSGCRQSARSTAVPSFYPAEDAEQIMKRWRDFILTAPDDINGWLGFHYVPPAPMFPQEHHFKKVCILVWCYTGAI